MVVSQEQHAAPVPPELLTARSPPSLKLAKVPPTFPVLQRPLRPPSATSKMLCFLKGSCDQARSGPLNPCVMNSESLYHIFCHAT